MRRKKIWTEEQENVLREQYLSGTKCCELAEEFGCSEPTVYSKLRSMGITVGRGSMKRAWTPEEEQYLREHFPSEAAVDIADVLGVSSTMVRVKAKEMGLEKSSDYDVRKYYHRYVKDYRHNMYEVKSKEVA